MPSRKVQFHQGHYYHVFNRGVDRSNIFFSSGNYLYLLRLVQKQLNQCSISMIAYCLMPNHYHFLFRQDGGTGITVFMQILFNTYVQAVNNQFGRSGSLFGCRFKAVHVDNQDYLLHLCRYIHLNPLEAGLVAKLEDWPYSNYLEWINARKGHLKDEEFSMTYFQDASEYISFVHDTRLSEQLEFALKRYLIDG